MSKPDDIPHDVFEAAMLRVRNELSGHSAAHKTAFGMANIVARAILAERERCASVADREALARRNRQAEAATAHDEESHLLHALLAQQSDKIAAAIRKGGD